MEKLLEIEARWETGVPDAPEQVRADIGWLLTEARRLHEVRRHVHAAVRGWEAHQKLEKGYRGLGVQALIADKDRLQLAVASLKAVLHETETR